MERPLSLAARRNHCKRLLGMCHLLLSVETESLVSYHLTVSIVIYVGNSRFRMATDKCQMITGQ